MKRKVKSFISYIAVGLAFCVLLSLGFWQLERLREKQDMLTAIDSLYKADFDANVKLKTADIQNLEKGQFLRGTVSGTLLFDKAVWMNGYIMKGQPASALFVPLRLEAENTFIMVELGQALSLNALPAMPEAWLQKEGAEHITGLIRLPKKAGAMVPDNNPSKNQWSSFNKTELEKALKIEPILNAYIVAEKSPYAITGLTTAAPQKPELPNDHKQYAAFWFTMAGLLLILALYARYKKNA